MSFSDFLLTIVRIWWLKVDVAHTVMKFVISAQIGIVTPHLKNCTLWNKISKCVKFGTKSTHFEKKHSFSKCVKRGILTHFEKKTLKSYLHGWLYFSCLKVSNIMILSIVRSFVMCLKNYCWDKSGFASCKLKQFMQNRFCQGFSHRRIIGNY